LVLANARDFLAPVAHSRIATATSVSSRSMAGNLWEAEIDHSPLDIVAWRGNYVPFKYDLYRSSASTR
jgi:homogentisate 1,2-dioxygenase